MLFCKLFAKLFDFFFVFFKVINMIVSWSVWIIQLNYILFVDIFWKGPHIYIKSAFEASNSSMFCLLIIHLEISFFILAFSVLDEAYVLIELCCLMLLGNNTSQISFAYFTVSHILSLDVGRILKYIFFYSFFNFSDLILNKT